MKFHKTFGCNIGPQISITCKEGHTWLAGYDNKLRKINSLEEFMKQHKVKQQSILMFEYIGRSEFAVTIYPPFGLEADYRFNTQHHCKRTVLNERFKAKEYIVGEDDMEREKSLALFYFNGMLDRSNYYIRSMREYNLLRPCEDLVRLFSLCIVLNLFTIVSLYY